MTGRAQDGREKRILVVDDSIAVRTALASVLSAHGFDVIEAENGAEGVARAEETKPDLLLVDVTMPVMDGLDAVRAIRQIDGLEATPIFMLTTTMSKALVEQGREAGATAWLVKPLDERLLLSGIKAVLGLSW